MQGTVGQTDERHLTILIFAKSDRARREKQRLHGLDLGPGEQREDLEDQEGQHAKDRQDHPDATEADQPPHPTIDRQGHRPNVKTGGVGR